MNGIKLFWSSQKIKSLSTISLLSWPKIENSYQVELTFDYLRETTIARTRNLGELEVAGRLLEKIEKNPFLSAKYFNKTYDDLKNWNINGMQLFKTFYNQKGKILITKASYDEEIKIF